MDKTYYDYTSGHSGTYTVSDTVWIPSYREMFGGTTAEGSGTVYTDFFTDNASRLKKQGLYGSAYGWWLRSAYSTTDFRFVYNSGSASNIGAGISYGVVLGFCT